MIEFSDLNRAIRLWERIGPRRPMHGHPVGHGLMHDAEVPRDPPLGQR